MIDQGKHSILGIRVDAVDYDTVIDRVFEAARNDRPLSVSALAVHGLMTGALDPTHKYRLNAFDLLCPDGQPVRWALNFLHGTALSQRVYGPELMLQLCQRAADERIPAFLFGGSDDLLRNLQKRLHERFPTLTIAGARASRFRTLNEGERMELVEEIRSSGARMAFVGLGCPRQEVFVYEMRESLSMPLLAVGAAFNFHAGRLNQAPSWMQDRGLEWAYRLAKEPQRLWRRYVLLNPLYLGLLGLQASGVYSLPPEGKPPTQKVSYG